MKIQLKKPLAFLDVETTGLDLVNDRIISIAIIKLLPIGGSITRSYFIHPERKIPRRATLINGITNKKVAKSPKFHEIALGLSQFLSGCDLAGFNSTNFDIPILSEHFSRCNIDFPEFNAQFIDICNIYRKKERRTLTTGYRFYCDKELNDAHDALADTRASYEIFLAQLEKYPVDLKNIDSVIDFSKKDDRVDLSGKIVRDKRGEYVYNFGKLKGTRISKDTSFAQWMLGQTFFTKNTKMVVSKILGELNVQIQMTV